MATTNNADNDHRVSDDIRLVQLTPPGSACSIALGTGIIDTRPGCAQGLQLVIADVNARAGFPVDIHSACGARRAGGRGQRGPGVRVGLVRLLQRSGRQPLGSTAVACSRSAGRTTPVRALIRSKSTADGSCAASGTRSWRVCTPFCRPPARSPRIHPPPGWLPPRR